MVRLQALRTKLEFPFPITSAYRCANHPIERQKKMPGAHYTGRAVDIAVSHEKAYHLVQEALQAGFTGIGVKQKGAIRFIHLDDLEDSPSRPRPHIWSY